MKKIIFLLCFSLIGQGSAQTIPPSVPNYIVGSDADYPPFQIRDGGGKIIGFEPDVLKRIGELEGFTVEVVFYPRPQWLSTLEEGKVDIFASSLGISSYRKEKAEMTDPTIDYYEAIYILDKPENNNIQKMGDFLNKKFVGVDGIRATSDFVKNLNDGSNSIDVEKTIFLALREVWAGRADAVTNSNLFFQYYGKKYPQFKYRLIPIEPKEYRSFGFAVKKGRTDLRDTLNRGLRKAKADGSFQRIFEKWFGAGLKS